LSPTCRIYRLRRGFGGIWLPADGGRRADGGLRADAPAGGETVIQRRDGAGIPDAVAPRRPRKLKTPKSLADAVASMRHRVLVRRPDADSRERAVPTAFSKAKRP